MKGLVVGFIGALVILPAGAQVCDPVDTQVQKLVQARLGDPDNEVNFWLRFNVGPSGHRAYRTSDGEAYFRDREARIIKFQRWASSLRDPRTRTAYLAILDSYADGVVKAEAEL